MTFASRCHGRARRESRSSSNSASLCAFRAFGWIEKVNLPEPLKGNAPAKNYAGKAVAMSRALKSAMQTRKVSRVTD